MGSRRKRARRHDPRTMTAEQYAESMVERYRVAWRRWWIDYNARTRTSPYTAIERLRYP